MYSAYPITSASAVLIQVPTPAQTSAAVNTATPAHVQLVDGGFLGDGVKLFLKGQPKALGVVQIMIGVLSILLGIVLAVSAESFYVFYGLTFWGSIIYIITGLLCVAAENITDPTAKICLVRGSLGMNITSAVTAGIAFIFTGLELGRLSSGITGVLLVFSVLEFITSICLAGFSCKVCCSSSPQYVSHIVAQPSCPPPSLFYQNSNSEANTSWKNQHPEDGLPPYSCEG